MSHFGGNLLPGAEVAPVVAICLKSLLLHAIAVIESMDPPQVAAAMMEYGLIVQDPTVKVKSFILRYRLASSD